MATLDSLFDAAARSRLDEMEFKDLMGEIIFGTPAGQTNEKLPFRNWAPLIPFVKYQGYRKNTLKFFVPNRYNGWNTYIQFDEWDEQVADTSVSAAEAARLLLWGGNLRLHCDCPAYSYWGFNYICTQLDAAIVPETRFPKKRNPDLKGICCKHQIRVLKVLPFHLGTIASAIKEQRAGLPVKPKLD